MISMLLLIMFLTMFSSMIIVQVLFLYRIINDQFNFSSIIPLYAAVREGLKAEIQNLKHLKLN
jgi:hypothetical protein